MFSNKKKVNNYEPTKQSIYITLFVEYFNKISDLENEYLNAVNYNTSKDTEINIKKNLYFFKILLDETEPKYLNITIPINRSHNMVYENSIDIVNYKPQYQIILDKLKTVWLKNYIMKLWISSGGLLTSEISIEYLKKYEFVKFLNEIEKKFTAIDKSIVKEYKNKYYDMLDEKNKLRLNTYLTYLLLKNQIKNITTYNLEQIVRYYNLGLDFNLLDIETTQKLFEYLNKYYSDKEIDDVTHLDLLEYEKIINANNFIIDKQFKINEYQKKYYIHKLNNLLFSPDYKKYVNEIFDYKNKLKNLNYEFNSKLKKKFDVFKMELAVSEHKFNPDLWFPLFTSDELTTLKEQLLMDVDNICKVVKDLFTYYNISNDFFCLKSNHLTHELSYLNQKDIYRTINAYCIILIIIGLVNYKLNITQQNYQIIIKGGKALQFILSEIYSNKKNDIQYKSNDIDLIICPNEGIEYNEIECKNLTNNLSFLIQWILNKNENPYDVDTYISRTPGQEYKTLMKLSHKIQKSTNEFHLSSYTALVDLDYGKKNNLFYNNLIHDNKMSKYGKLLFVYQNLDSFILEKLYYLNYYIKEKNILEEKYKNNTNNNEDKQKAKIDAKNYKNYERFINNFSSQIKQALKIISLSFNKNEIIKYIIDLIQKNNITIQMNHVMPYIY